MSLLQFLKRTLSLSGIALLFWSAAVNARELDLGALTPSTLFVQAGVAEEHTQAYIVGASWDWPWRKQYSSVLVSGYFDAAFGRWMTKEGGVSGSAWATQIGLTPVLRFQTMRTGDWFAEIGVGANFILPIYRSRDKRFSTEFNFGDHLAIGRQFGAQRQHELALRIEHFSNGGIDHPNPGENFVQLRYARRF